MKHRERRRNGMAVAGLICAASLVGFGDAVAGLLDGDPFRGRILFVEKLCNQCHSIWGHGGTLGPEITHVVAGKSLPQLSGEFWNHTPRMIEEMSLRGYAWPKLDRREMADLLSYLYYLRLFDEPGSPSRGAATFVRLHCESCHSLGGAGGDVGGPLDPFSRYASPIPLAQAMWNAGPAMRRMQIGRGTPIPQFSGGEMADIQAYIREHGSRSGDGPVDLLPLPDPAVGEKVFSEKGCAVCHETRKAGAPDLGEAALRLTVAEISGILWNHSYAMQDRMSASGIPFPRFEGRQLADVVSYLHLLGYRGREGNPSRGSEVFRQNQCAACHDDQLIEAPDLTTTHSGDDAVALSVAMWNHAPEMHEVMALNGVPWPQFREGDVEDLVAYLKRRSAGGAPKGD